MDMRISGSLLLALLSTSLLAEEGELPRPDDLNNVRTTTAWLMPEGEWEIEVVASYADFGAVEVGEVRGEVATAFNEWFMVEVEVPFVQVDFPGGTERGLGDIEIEAKAALTTWESIDIAAMLELELPTGDEDKGLGSGRHEIEAWGLASRAFDDIETSGHLGIGTEWEEGEGLEGLLINAAVDNTSLSEELALQLGINSAFGDGDSIISLIGGLRTEVEGTDLELEASLGFAIGLTDDAEDWALILAGELEF